MQRQTLITLLLAVFIALLGIGIIVPVMPVFATDLGAGGVALGMIIAAFSISRGLLQPIIGNLSDKLGRKRFLVVGLFIYGLVGLMIPHATAVAHLITIRGFHGVGSAMIVPIAMAYMSALAPAGQEGRYMSYLNIAIFTGIGCGPIIGGILFDVWGIEAVFYMMALLSFIAFLLVLRYMPGHIQQDEKKQAGLFISMKRMVKRRKTLGILIARYATMIMMVPTMAFLPVLMSRWQESSGLQIGIVIACRTLVNASLQVPFGKIADTHNKVILLVAGCTSMCCALLLVPMANGFVSMILLYGLLGLGEAVIWPVLGAYASEEGKAFYGHGTMMGMFSLAMSAGVFTGAILGGISMDYLGIQWAFYVASFTVFTITMAAAMMIWVSEAQEALAK